VRHGVEGWRAAGDEERMESVVVDDGGCVGRGSGGRCGWAEGGMHRLLVPL